MIPNDRRRTNFTVDDTLLVRRKLVVSELELNILRALIEVVTPKAEVGDVRSDSIETKAIEITSDSKQTNVLYTLSPASIVSGQLAQFSYDAKTQITPIPASVITGNILNYMFLDGSDGNQTISAPFKLLRDYYYDTLTIDAGGVIDPNGFVIYCKTALVNNGVFRINGGNGDNAVAGVGGAGSGVTPVDGQMFVAFPGGQGANAGADGGSASASISVLGGLGGTGGNSATNNGGFSQSGVSWFNNDTVMKNPTFFPLLGSNSQTLGLGGIPGMGGGGGAGGALGGGGGGGAGGGWITVVAKSISGSGTFEAKGGAGGAGATDGGGGGGGGGGIVYFLAQTNTISAAQVFVTGGAGGAAGGGTALAGQVGFTGRYQNNLLM